MNDIISIVTPSYNQASFISETIESVLSQEGDFYLDYIIIDGDSNDGSIEIISRYKQLLQTQALTKKINGLDFYISKRRDRLNRCKGISYRWISEKDEGHGDALNKGFKMSAGDVMGWLNSDDIYVDGALNNVFNVFKQFAQVNWLTGLNTQIHKDGTRIALPFLYRNNYKNIFSILTNDHEFIQQESTLWKRELWEKAGGYINTSYKLMIDGELWCRFFLHATLFHLHREIGSYRRHETNRAHQFMPQVRAELKKAVQWLENQVDNKILEIARNLMENAPLKPVSDYDMDFLIIDKNPDNEEWIINKVNFCVYSSKRRFLKLQANQNIYEQNIKQKNNLISQKDKDIADKDDIIKKINLYAEMAEKLAHEKSFILEKRENELSDIKNDLNSKDLQIEHQNVKINHLVNEYTKKDNLLNGKLNEINKLNKEVESLKLSLKDSESRVELLSSEIISIKLSMKDKESLVEKLESVNTEQKNNLEIHTTLSQKQQEQLSAFQDKIQNNEDLIVRLREEIKILNHKIKKANEKEKQQNNAIREHKNQINELKEFIREIEKSYTFRVGKAIIWPASKIKQAMQKK